MEKIKNFDSYINESSTPKDNLNALSLYELGRLLLKEAKKDSPDVQAIQDLLDAGCPIDVRTDSHQHTALHLAAMRGNIELVEFLISRGSYVESRDMIGSTALHWAAMYGHLEIVKFLVSKGTLVNARDDMGWTALHWAAGYGHLEIVKFLVSKGANIETRDATKGWTALHLATQYGKIEVMEFLISAGADIHARNNEGKTAWDLANDTTKETVPELNPNI